MQYHCSRTVIRGNIMDATGPAHALVGTVPRAQDDASGQTPRLDGNLYYASGGRPDAATFGVLGVTYRGWRAYLAATGQDSHSRYREPGLRHPVRGDLHLRRGSPAVDTGLPVRSREVGGRDIDGQARIQGRKIDVGADER